MNSSRRGRYDAGFTEKKCQGLEPPEIEKIDSFQGRNLQSMRKETDNGGGGTGTHHLLYPKQQLSRENVALIGFKVIIFSLCQKE